MATSPTTDFLTDRSAELFTIAREVAKKSYDPYHQTQVGAVAIATEDMLKDFTFYTGAFIANAAGGSSICAEEAAMANAISTSGRSTKIVALYVVNKDSSPPCDQCLEIIRELGYASTKVAWGGVTELKFAGEHELKERPSVLFAKESDVWHYPKRIRNGEALTSIYRPALQAAAAGKEAYCPHSNDRVGAAIKTTHGIYTGCSIVNKSRGISLCAERVAIAKAVAQEGPAMQILAVSVASVDGAATPCGSCRQLINEFAAKTMTIQCVEKDGVPMSEDTHDALFPKPFGSKPFGPKQMGLK